MAILESEKMKRLKGLTRSYYDFEYLEHLGKRSSGRFAKRRHTRRERSAWKREIASVVGDDGAIDEEIERENVERMEREYYEGSEYYFWPFPSYDLWLAEYGLMNTALHYREWLSKMIYDAIDNKFEIEFGEIKTLSDVVNFLQDVDPTNILCHRSILRPIAESMRPF